MTEPASLGNLMKVAYNDMPNELCHYGGRLFTRYQHHVNLATLRTVAEPELSKHTVFMIPLDQAVGTLIADREHGLYRTPKTTEQLINTTIKASLFDCFAMRMLHQYLELGRTAQPLIYGVIQFMPLTGPHHHPTIWVALHHIDHFSQKRHHVTIRFNCGLLLKGRLHGEFAERLKAAKKVSHCVFIMQKKMAEDAGYVLHTHPYFFKTYSQCCEKFSDEELTMADFHNFLDVFERTCFDCMLAVLRENKFNALEIASETDKDYFLREFRKKIYYKQRP
ncbi:hypothetical protein IV38_GL001358 [Lactobacillus selangorensis]|uniref:Uncharacterized protein n=1 Tax=Lactobacillus selangorensis TaxID=81857 RepID=A0A0R2FSG4_9LACO|nr:hypothetical protein [Lactobacillus selangorensis]KRN28359.1 hypothetical protein IV38_GL001358 [Lactobacillus selangorensis]KRN31860.1 hypothetical protein IV40_GL001145 [Lactobacillus selangorensis]